MSTCSRCGAPFSCSLVAADGAASGADAAAGDVTGAAACWCMALPALAAVPAPEDAGGCWCRACLTAYLDEQTSVAPRAAPPSSI